jgi:hypothetical protein
MKIEKFQLCGNSSVCAAALQLLRGRAPAQLRGNIPYYIISPYLSKRFKIDHHRDILSREICNLNLSNVETRRWKAKYSMCHAQLFPLPQFVPDTQHRLSQLE